MILPILVASLGAQELPRIAARTLKADVAFLASDLLQGRATPSPGLEIAADYIAAQFRRAGLEPLDQDSHFWTARHVSVLPNPDGLELSLDVDGKAVKVDRSAMVYLDPAGTDLNRRSVLRVTPSGLASLQPDQVRGKVLVVDITGERLPSTRGLRALAVSHEPALILVLIPKAIQAPSRFRLREVGGASPKAPILAVWDPALHAAFKKDPKAFLTGKLPPPLSQVVTLRNVVGLLRGTDPVLKDTCLVVSAHYDHVGIESQGEGDTINNGANDNASGVATLIGVAQALAATKPRRSLVFVAFYGEEVGGLGSQFYASHPVFPLDRTLAEINLEQTGRTDDTEGARPRQFNLTGLDYTNLAESFVVAGSERGVKVVHHPTHSDRYFQASDNAIFANLGIPSTTLSVT